MEVFIEKLQEHWTIGKEVFFLVVNLGRSCIASEKLVRLEKEKGIVVRFVIGHSATPGGALDQAIDIEEAETREFMWLDHVEGYHELSSKTRIYFSTAVATWDAAFYIKVDGDVHVNLGMLQPGHATNRLARYRTTPRVYVGCMKFGPVLSQKGVMYHEPESWKFGDEGNKYFRHAMGQIYAISRDLASYISLEPLLRHAARLRGEEAGRERVRRVLRLVLQRHLQVRRQDECHPQRLRRGRRSCLVLRRGLTNHLQK